MTITKRHYKTLLIEIGNAITHGLGAALAIAGLVVLIVHAALHPQVHNAMRITTFAHFHASQTRFSGF